jgi:hypothetical protein
MKAFRLRHPRVAISGTFSQFEDSCRKAVAVSRAAPASAPTTTPTQANKREMPLPSGVFPKKANPSPAPSPPVSGTARYSWQSAPWRHLSGERSIDRPLDSCWSCLFRFALQSQFRRESKNGPAQNEGSRRPLGMPLVTAAILRSRAQLLKANVGWRNSFATGMSRTASSINWREDARLCRSNVTAEVIRLPPRDISQNFARSITFIPE